MAGAKEDRAEALEGVAGTHGALALMNSLVLKAGGVRWEYELGTFTVRNRTNATEAWRRKNSLTIAASE